MYQPRLMLLNTVIAASAPSSFGKGTVGKRTRRPTSHRMPSMKTTSDCIRRLEQRKLDNLQSAFDFVKEMGARDIQYIKDAKEWCEERASEPESSGFDPMGPTTVVSVEDDDIFSE